MKKCLACYSFYSAEAESCISCNSVPVIINGFESFAPNLANSGGGFKAKYFGDLFALEEFNFWFRSRNNLIVWLIKKYMPNFRSLLEIGCGTGFVLNGIFKSFPDKKIFGSEIFTTGLVFASTRLPSVKFMQMDAREIPFREEFDIIGAFDVLEHIEDDKKVLNEIHDALNPKGIIIVTVPQHKWLWSRSDEFACHFRRYSDSEINGKISESGFRILRSSSFVTLLLQAMFISRFLNKERENEKYDATSELKISIFLNVIFYFLLNFELLLIILGLNFRVGGSRFVVAEKI